MNSTAESNANPWAILHGGALGDLILTLNLFEQIAPHHKPNEAPTTVISRIDLNDALPQHANYNFINADTLDLHKLFTENPSPISRELQSHLQHRHILNTFTDQSAPLHKNLLQLQMGDRGSCRAVVGETHDCSPRASIANEIISLDTHVNEDSNNHAIQQWRKQLNKHQLDFKPTPPPPPTSTTSATTNTKALRNKKILLQPGSGGRHKRWPTANYATLATELAANNAQPHFLLGPVELDTFTDHEQSQLATAAPIIKTNTLRNFATELKQAHAYIGNDAGSTHFAAYHNIPTIALYGPTRATIWHPIANNVRCIQGDHTKENWNITPHRIIAQLAALFGRTTPRAAPREFP